jgi:hypothetical protein
MQHNRPDADRTKLTSMRAIALAAAIVAVLMPRAAAA